jgi:hypothetical protein
MWDIGKDGCYIGKASQVELCLWFCCTVTVITVGGKKWLDGGLELFG